jgi:GT2 family glycosyltransferase/peptidoglycan/xylan/chitin deacetylase (PgdA/CDA1 family)
MSLGRQMKISVVIPTYNRRDVLARSLPRLFDQDFPADDYEIILVIDGSKDGTAEMVRSMAAPCRLSVIEQNNQGAAIARNTGVSACSTNLVLFLDDDILCPRNLIREHVAAHDGRKGIVSHGPIFVAPESPATLVAESTKRWYESHYQKFTAERPVDVYRLGFLISNSCVRRDLFLACGGFDPDMFLLEDTELGIRLAKWGARFVYLPNAVVYELFAKSTRTFVNRDAARQGKAEIILCRKHPDYRPFSALGNLGETTVTTRFVRELVLRSRLRFHILFEPPVWMLERLARFESCRQAGLYVLGVSRRLAFLRSAVHEAGSYRALKRQFGMVLPVLLYHNVGPMRPGSLPGLTVSPKKFARHVRWLARRGFSGIRPSDWLRWLRYGTGLPDKPILLTFDDGYADIAEYALPVLRRYGFSGAVYIVTGQVGGINAWDKAKGSSALHLMTREQIRYWAAQGIEFGAHSRTHRYLGRLSATELATEGRGSKDDLTDLLGSPIYSFAYPYGDTNEAVSAFARGEFDLAFTDERGLNYLRTNPHLLRRINISPNNSLIDVECHIRWGELPRFSRLRARLKVRSRLKKAAGLSWE